MNTNERLVDAFVDVGELCAEQGVLPEAMGSLITRLRGVADGECDPPDLDGLCMACGRKIAPPVRNAKHGCSPLSLAVIPALRARRLAVRCQRLGRLMLAAARPTDKAGA